MSHLPHLRHQRAVVAALGQTALRVMRQRLSKPNAAQAPAAPGPWLQQTLAPRPATLVRDYTRHVGGDPRAYRGQLPPHLFPQWGFPLLSRTLHGISYPIERVLNGGCGVTFNAPIPDDAPLQLKARLEDVDDDGRRAILTQSLITGTDQHPEALVVKVQAIIPLKRERDPAKRKKKTPARVPSDARELAFWSLKSNDGAAFASLTGDINPIHWLTPYARAAGFKNPILHGYSTMARAIEGLNRHLWMGDVHKLTQLDVRFTRPLVLPARVGLYVAQDDDRIQVFVGDAPGGPAYMSGVAHTTH